MKPRNKYYFYLVIIFRNSLIILIFILGLKSALLPTPFLVFYSNPCLLVYVKYGGSVTQDCTCLKNVLRKKYSAVKYIEILLLWVCSCTVHSGHIMGKKQLPVTSLPAWEDGAAFLCLAFAHLLTAHLLQWRLLDHSVHGSTLCTEGEKLFLVLLIILYSEKLKTIAWDTAARSCSH